jgi:ABC-2 type transport system permease protein
MNDLTINGRTQLNTLWRLRGKLTWRQFGRERGRIVGAAFVIFFFGPMILAAAFGTAVGYRRLPDQWPTALLGGVLTLLWIIWLVFPIIFASINEGADITLLMIYPIQRRTLIASVLLGTLFDYPTYLMLPLFLAIFVGFGLTFSLTAVIVLIALVLSYGHLVMIGQFVGTAVGGIMQSRRLRDVVIVVASTIGGLCYFINIGIQRLIGDLFSDMSEEQAQAMLQWQPLDALQWLPPGATAKAIERSVNGDWLASLFWLLYSLAWLVLITWVWYKLLVRLTTGEGYLLFTRPRAEAHQRAQKTEKRERNWLGWLPDDVALLVANEFKSVWRIPQRRVGIIQGVLMPLFFMGAFFFSGDAGRSSFSGGVPSGTGLGLPLYALFLFWANTQNMLAWEGRGLPALLLSPVRRERIFWAKGGALYVVTLLPLLFFGGLLIFMQQNWVSVAGVLTAFVMGVTTVAVTAVSSVLFPIPIALESRRNRGLFQSGGDSKTGCAYITLVPLAVLIFSLPTVLPLGLAYGFELPWLAFVGLVFSLAYAVVIFWGGCRMAGNLLLAREPELVAKMKLPDEA